MKPDGVATAALEPMETLEANPVDEGIPAPEQEPNQEASPGEGEAVQQSQIDTEPSKATPTAKTSSKPSGDSKSKTPSKNTKTKPGTTPSKTTTASKTPGRLSNGVSKTQTNGVPKKTTPASDRKSTPVTAAPKKPTGTTPTPKSTLKTAEKKTPAASPLTNGAKTTTAAKKTATASANGVKTSSTSAAAKKPAGSKPVTSTGTKPSSTASPKPDKTPVSKATRTPSATSTARPPSSSITKSSAAAPKPATPKPSTTTTTSKPATSKPTTPSAGKSSALQASKTTTPVKKDVTKPTPSSAKKPVQSSLARTASAAKSAKQDAPKSTAKTDTAPKKSTTSKALDTKTPNRAKPESKAPPSKDASKAPKTAATRTTSPKKTVGSSTPTPVKRGPKANEADKDVAVAAATAATAAAIAAATSVIAKPEEQLFPEEAMLHQPEPIMESLSQPSTDPGMQLNPEPITEPTPEPIREPTPEPIREPTPEPIREPTPEPIREPTPEPIREPTPEPIREPTPEPIREPTPEPIREPTPEPIREPTPEPIREPTPEPIREPTPEPIREPTPEPIREPTPELHELQTNDSVTSLGTTVMSPPCSPTGPVSPPREASNASLLDFQSDLMNFQNKHKDVENEERDEEEEPNEKENVLVSAQFGATSTVMAEAQTFSATSHFDAFASGNFMSPHEKEEAVEKAEEEINEDDEDEEDEDEEQRKFGYQPSSIITDMSSSQPSEDQVKSSAFGGSLGWHGDDLLSGMDSEDMSSCTSSRQQGVSDLSSTLHTAILEGTQSSDALVDSSLRGSEGDANLTGSPNVETLANEEEDEDEDERVDDMDLSSEKVDEHQKVFSNQDHEEEDEDVEMNSEGKTESGENVEEDFNEDERLDNLNQCGLPINTPPASSWGQTNPFSDTWAQPATVSSPSPISDHGAADSETPTQSPAQTCFDGSVPTFAAQSGDDHLHHMSASRDVDLSAPAADVPVRFGGSETSTPEDLCEYDSSSGIESRSDKQQTPVPAQVQPDLEQDLGIHMEKVDGEEEEAETLPADEVLGTGPPTAPASAPSSASTSGDEASDTEGEMQINDPDEPMTMESAGFDSPTPTSNLPAFDEDEEVVQAASVEAEEDGGGATPQSANSVASYGFDCTNSNSNAHSMAESCGKSPGIFSLENEEQLPEEAKDPTLIKELTLPSTGAAAEDLLGRPVDLLPLSHSRGHSGDLSDLDEDHYMMGGKMGADLLHDAEPREPGHLQDSGDSDENQPPYYSTICDKTDSFLEGNEISDEEDEDARQSQKNAQNQNHNGSLLIANGHYLALVPGNRRPIDPALAEHFGPLIESCTDAPVVGEQYHWLEKHQEKLQELQQCKEQERLKTHWLEEEAQRLEQQKQLEEQRQELLQLQHRHRLQWQLELELQYRMHQKHLQQQQQLRRSPTGLMLSPSSGLCTIYEAMETSDEEEENDMNMQKEVVLNGHNHSKYGSQNHMYPMQELEWNMKMDMVQQLINQTLMLSEDGSSLLLLPVGTGGSLSPLESTMWPQFSPPTATVTSVSSYSPDSHGSSPPGDWTVVEMETQH